MFLVVNSLRLDSYLLEDILKPLFRSVSMSVDQEKNATSQFFCSLNSYMVYQSHYLNEFLVQRPESVRHGWFTNKMIVHTD